MSESSPPSSGDPRLEIPEVLRTPVKKPQALVEYDKADAGRGKVGASDAARQASSWAIAMNFVWTLAAALLLGWALQKWVWPAAAPWPMLVGLFVGLVLGMVRFMVEALKASRNDR